MKHTRSNTNAAPAEHLDGKDKYKHRVGLFSVALAAYWPQFATLQERLKAHNATLAQLLGRYGSEIINLGIIDGYEQAIAAGHALRSADVDLVFLDVATYALSATVLPVLRRLAVPVIVLSLSDVSAVDYSTFNQLQDRRAMTGEWLAHCQACSVPEISNVFLRLGIPFHQVIGSSAPDDDAWKDIEEWIHASRVESSMARGRLGLMGHYYSGMMDMYSDLTLQSAIFGTHIELLEIDDLSRLRSQVNQAEIASRLNDMSVRFELLPDCSAAALQEAARTSVALDRFVKEHRLDALAYYYRGTGIPANQQTIDSIIAGNSLLTERGIPVVGELAVKTLQAMKILSLLGVGGSFTEYYATDFLEDVILMGHDGPGDITIADSRPRLRALASYHGKTGKGLSIEMTVKHGPVTLFSVAEDGKGSLRFIVAEGESVPGPILEIGNTNSRYRFAMGARAFLREWNAAGPTHHWAIGTGRKAGLLSKLASILKVECITVG